MICSSVNRLLRMGSPGSCCTQRLPQRMDQLSGTGSVVASRNGVLPELVWVLSGKNGSVIHMLEGARPGDGFGCTMDVCGDLDGDGVADVIVGAWGNYGERVIGGGLISCRHRRSDSRVVYWYASALTF